MTRGDYANQVGLAALWGSSYPFIKVALAGHVGPFEIVLLRLVIATALLYGVTRVQGFMLPRDGRAWRSFLVMGLVGTAMPFFFISWGETRIDSSLAAILNATVPFFTVLLAHFWTRDERLTAAGLAGIAIGFAGVVVLVGNISFSSDAAALLGVVSLLLSSICYAIANTFARRAFHDVAPVVASTGQMLLGTVFISIPGLVTGLTARQAPDWSGLAAVGGLAVLGTVSAYLIYYRLMARVGPSRTAAVAYMLPGFAVLYGVVLLHEPVTARFLAGFALILVGVAVVNARTRSQRARDSATAQAAR